MSERLDFRADIAEALKDSNLLSSDFKLVNPYEYENILIAILDRFTTLGKGGLVYSRWWDSLKDPKCSIQIDYAPLELMKLVTLEEKVWFIAEDWVRTKRYGNFWLYEGKIAAIVNVLENMYRFDYYIVSNKFEWLICENHHGTLMGVDSPMVEKIRELAQS